MKKITLLLLMILPLISLGQVSNGTFDTDISGWVSQNGATISWDGTEGNTATGALKIITTTATNTGTKTPSPNAAPYAGAGDYTLSVWVKGTAGNQIRLDAYQGSYIGGTLQTLATSDWELITQDFIGLTADPMNVRIIGATASSTYFIDDVIFTNINSTTEDSWVTNPNFEATTNWTDNGSEASSTYVTTAPYEGSQNLLVTFNADQTANFTIDNDLYDFGQTVTPSEISTTFWVKASSTAIQIQINFDIYDATGTFITGNNTGVYNVSAVNTWEEVTFNKAISNPFNQIVYRLKIKSPGALNGDTVEFDQITASFSYETLSTNSPNESVNFSMYPNPTNGVLNIAYQGTIKNVEVFDITGKQVLSTNGFTNSTQLNVSNLNSGIYLVKLVDDSNNSSIKKLVLK